MHSAAVAESSPSQTFTIPALSLEAAAVVRTGRRSRNRVRLCWRASQLDTVPVSCCCTQPSRCCHLAHQLPQLHSGDPAHELQPYGSPGVRRQLRLCTLGVAVHVRHMTEDLCARRCSPARTWCCASARCQAWHVRPRSSASLTATTGGVLPTRSPRSCRACSRSSCRCAQVLLHINPPSAVPRAAMQASTACSS